MKKLAFILFLLVFVVGSLFSGAYLICSVLDTYDEITNPTYSVSKTLENKKDINPINYQGIYTLFNSIKIDRSNITPLLLLWFFLPVTLNSIRSLKQGVGSKAGTAKNKIDNPISPESYASTWIQFGFIGTLWGFMIIGFKMKDSVGGSTSVDDLDLIIDGFGTALLSTFTAVVLVYVFAPLVVQCWRWFHGLPAPSISNISYGIENQLASLTNNVSKTNDSVMKLNGEINALGKNISKLTLEEFIREVANISDSIESLGIVGNTLHTIKAMAEKSERKIDKLPGKIDGSINRERKNLDRKLKEEYKKNRELSEITKNEIESSRKSIENKVKNIDNKVDGLTKETNKGINNLGKNIGSIKESMENKIDINEMNIKKELQAKLKSIDTQINALKKQIDLVVNLKGYVTTDGKVFRRKTIITRLINLIKIRK